MTNTSNDIRAIGMSRNVTPSAYTLSMPSESPLGENASNQNTVSLSVDPISMEMVDLVTDIFSCHVNPLVSACGIVGNVLNIVVFLMQKRSQPMNSLLVVLAFVDAFYLVFANLEFVACSIRPYDVIAARNFVIMTLPHLIWIGVALNRISSMLTVVISVERCLVVMMPLKVKTLVTPFVIHVTTALACVIPAFTHIPLFLRGEIHWVFNTRLNVSLPYMRLTQFALDHSHFLNLYKNLVLNILFRYVTMGVISVCTGFTIAQLKRYSQWRLRSVSSERERSTMSERDTRVSLTMVRICVLFLICSLPGCIMLTYRLIEPEFDYYGIYSQSFDLSREVGNFFTVINSSCNFIIYMRGEDDFRKTFCNIFQRLFPSCCFNFLCRCVMRSDGDRNEAESQKTSADQARDKKKEGNGGTGGNVFASTTNVSRAFTSAATQNA